MVDSREYRFVADARQRFRRQRGRRLDSQHGSSWWIFRFKRTGFRPGRRRRVGDSASFPHTQRRTFPEFQERKRISLCLRTVQDTQRNVAITKWGKFGTFWVGLVRKVTTSDCDWYKLRRHLCWSTRIILGIILSYKSVYFNSFLTIWPTIFQLLSLSIFYPMIHSFARSLYSPTWKRTRRLRLCSYNIFF